MGKRIGTLALVVRGTGKQPGEKGNSHGASFVGEDRVEVCRVAGGGAARSAGAGLGAAGAAVAEHRDGVRLGVSRESGGVLELDGDDRGDAGGDAAVILGGGGVPAGHLVAGTTVAASGGSGPRTGAGTVSKAALVAVGSRSWAGVRATPHAANRAVTVTKAARTA